MSINVGGYIVDIWKKTIYMAITLFAICLIIYIDIYLFLKGITHKYEFNHITFDPLSTIPKVLI
jgi:hypothetical protein